MEEKDVLKDNNEKGKQPLKGFKKYFYIFSLCVLGLVLLLEIFMFSVSGGVFGKLPSTQDLENRKTSQASEIYSADRKLLGKYYYQDRSSVPYEKISPHLINALIATEDVRFYDHSGVDFKGVGRVVIKTILLGKDYAGGGSTITQQLAKNLFPRTNQNKIINVVIAKVKEWATAARIERHYSKKEILTMYFNAVPFGENTFGIKTASETFFNKTPDKLRPEEAAVLIGMLKATTTYNPLRNPKNALRRRNIVLGLMAKQNFITFDQAATLRKLPLKLDHRKVDHNEGLAPYFREQLRKELEEWTKTTRRLDGNGYNIYTDGLKIYTTIDTRFQQYAEEAVKEHMKLLQREFYAHWGRTKPWGNEGDVVKRAIERSSRFRIMKEDEATDREIDRAFKKKVKMKIFTWYGARDTTLSPLDSIFYYQSIAHAGFLVMEPATGYVKAWVGDINHEFFQYDHVNLNAKRQVGSTFKPFVYAAALDRGYDPCFFIPNEPVVFEDFNDWTPENADRQYGNMLTLKEGLTHSVNTITAWLIKEIGPRAAIGVARRAGVKNHMELVPSIALGTADLSLLEMVSSYTPFVNSGNTAKPVYILRVTDNGGNKIGDFAPEVTRAMNPQTAYTVLQLLQNVIDEGTGSKLRYQFGLHNEIAGKTGTTQNHSDGWFIGMVPQLVAGVWVGWEDRRVHFRSLKLGQGSAMALPIWGNFMRKVYADKSLHIYPGARFRRPPNYNVNLDCPVYVSDTLAEEGIDSLEIYPDNPFNRYNDTIKTRVDDALERLKEKVKQLPEENNPVQQPAPETTPPPVEQQPVPAEQQPPPQDVKEEEPQKTEPVTPPAQETTPE